MKIKLTIALVASLTSTAFAEFKAPLPEFKNEKQLAEWRAEKAAEATSQGYVAEETAFYTGKPYLASSDSYAFKYRSYNPKMARWTSEDPSGFPDGANGSMYSCNAPVCGIDSDGLQFLYFHGGTLTLQSGQGAQGGCPVDFGEVLESWGALSGGFGDPINDGWWHVSGFTVNGLTNVQKTTIDPSTGIWNQGSMSVWDKSGYTNEGYYNPNSSIDKAIGAPLVSEFKYYIDDAHDRTDIRIHPDGSPSGTQGCIGIKSYSDCQSIKNYIGIVGLDLLVE